MDERVFSGEAPPLCARCSLGIRRSRGGQRRDLTWEWSMSVDPQGSKADRVCRDAVVADAAHRALHGDGPVALVMEVTVHAGCHVGSLEELDTRTGPCMVIEGGIMPEDIERSDGIDAKLGGPCESLFQ